MTKRILQISPYSFSHPGGVEQYARILQEIFSDDMTTLAGGGDFPIVEPVHNCPLPCFWQKSFWNTFRYISPENTSAIISHIRFAPTSWLAFFLAQRKGIPYIHIEHGTGFLIHKNHFVAWVAKIVDYTIGSYIIHHANHVICISKAGEQWVRETFGRNSEIRTIYRGFHFPDRKRANNEIPKIGFVGRLTGLKNVERLLYTLNKVKNEKWLCEIVGDGEERMNLEKIVENLGLAERVKFLGARGHDWIINEFYPNIDIFVNPSLQEGLPTTVIEAVGMGCMVIASDVGGTNEIDNITLIPGKESYTFEKELLDKIKNPQVNNNKEIQFPKENTKIGFINIFNTVTVYERR